MRVLLSLLPLVWPLVGSVLTLSSLRHSTPLLHANAVTRVLGVRNQADVCVDDASLGPVRKSNEAAALELEEPAALALEEPVALEPEEPAPLALEPERLEGPGQKGGRSRGQGKSAVSKQDARSRV